MADQDDLLTSLVSGNPQSADTVKAIVNQLRGKQSLAELASLSGDPTLTPFGQHALQQNQQNEVELGRNAMQNRRDDLTQQNITRQLEQGQNALAETVRYHNMEDQERKDKLAQQKSQQEDLARSQDTIDKIGQYKLPMPTNRSARNAAIIDEVSRQYPDYDSTKFGEKQKAQVAFGSGPQSNLVRSADVSVQHLDAADELASGLHNGKYPAINAVVNWWKTQTGSPEIAKFNTAKAIVADEVNKFIIGGGGALADRELLQKQLGDAQSEEQLHGVTNTLRGLMGGQLKGLQSQFVNAGLGTTDDFMKKLNPRTIGALGLGEAQPGPPTSALPGATGAMGAPPAQGGGPPPQTAGSGSQGGPLAGPSGAPGAYPGSISPIEATLRQQTGFQGDGTPAPKSAVVDQQGIVRTGRRNGKRIGQLADGTIVPLE